MSDPAIQDSRQQAGSARDFFSTLNSGNHIPMVGFGTNGINGVKQCIEVLDIALGAGYRLFGNIFRNLMSQLLKLCARCIFLVITGFGQYYFGKDTAAMYGNEEDIGKALKQLLPKHELSRDDVFITTKLHPEEQGNKSVKALQKSLERLDCEYIDLYLINWPGSYGFSSSSKENANLREKSWENMVKAVDDGLVKNIGVSSYTIKHLKQLLSNDYGIKPCLNQVEWHPLCYQKKLQEFCVKNEILVQAYQSFGDTTSDDMNLHKHPTIVDISNKLKRTTAQVLLRWALQLNVAVVPKSATENRIISNMELDFTIPEADMKTLCGFKRQIRCDWDPDDIA